MGAVVKMRALAIIASMVLLAVGLASQRAAAQDLGEATRLNEQAKELWQQGRYADAEPLFKRSLKIRENVLDPEHPDVATSLNNLAALYGMQGRYDEAEPLHKRSLEIREKALGPDHTDVAQSLENLAKPR